MKFRTKSIELATYLRMGIGTYRGKLLVQSSFWAAALILGIVAVWFAKFISQLQTTYSHLFAIHPYWMSAFTPLAFVLATAIVKYLAPHAGGSGVPQALFASSLTNEENRFIVENGILSIRTAIVKVVSTGIGFLGGASIGGEGPTVQIAGSIFASFGNYIRKYFPRVDFHSYLVAAAGAGIASAFNTPLGGVVFALEEVAVGDFGGLRHLVMLAVIVAGLTARALVGDELYFGNPGLAGKSGAYLLWAILIGALGGISGGIFGKIVTCEPLHRLKLNWWMRALACGILVSAIGLLFSGATAGSGYQQTRAFIEGQGQMLPVTFPLAKLLATALSTLSGMGGGILAPSLSVGAWLGIAAGKLALIPDLNGCALLGMVAYFAGAFQIPMTAVVIVMEMTNEHAIIIPMMIAALTAFLVSRKVMPVPLYHVLIKRMFHKGETLSD